MEWSRCHWPHDFERCLFVSDRNKWLHCDAEDGAREVTSSPGVYGRPRCRRRSCPGEDVLPGAVSEIVLVNGDIGFLSRRTDGRRFFVIDLTIGGRIVDAMRANGAVTLSLVAVRDGQIIGHILYSPESIDEKVDGAALGPMAVPPSAQRMGFGSRLVEAGNRIQSSVRLPPASSFGTIGPESRHQSG